MADLNYQIRGRLLIVRQCHQPHTRLRGKVDDHRKSMSRKQLADGSAIDQIHSFEMKPFIILTDIESGRFQLRVIASVEVVQPDNAPA
jgi:hypothetical protein